MLFEHGMDNCCYFVHKMKKNDVFNSAVNNDQHQKLN